MLHIGAGTITASALNGLATTADTAGASQDSAMPLAAAVQVPAYAAASQQMPASAAQLPADYTSASTSALGRRLLDQVSLFLQYLYSCMRRFGAACSHPLHI